MPAIGCSRAELDHTHADPDGVADTHAQFVPYRRKVLFLNAHDSYALPGSQFHRSRFILVRDIYESPKPWQVDESAGDVRSDSVGVPILLNNGPMFQQIGFHGSSL